MVKNKTSIIVTVYNEQKTVERFIESVLSQSVLPDELIIVDGGSRDGTVAIIKKKIAGAKKINCRLIIKKGNRSVGRNEAIKNSTGDIILCSDSGNNLDSNWVRNIIKPFSDSKIDVVAGFYKGVAHTLFEKCLIPYALVMPDKVDPQNFLPATRSVAFRKRIWGKIGGFDESLSHNEDYFFANKLKESGAKIVFAKDAVVSWTPRKNLKEAFIMFFRFAYGDGEAGLIRDKVILIFARYLFLIYFAILFILIKSALILVLLLLAAVAYVLWAAFKNYKYVRDKKAVVILPVIQISSDLAVLSGTSLGLVKLFGKINYARVFKENFKFITLLAIYAVLMLFVIRSGIPNSSHPFAYQMDEWHQAQAVKSVFKFGSPNVEGSANGTMFSFFLTGILIAPLFLLHLINPLAIKSSVDSIADQNKVFIVLRLVTLFFGILSVINLSVIAKNLKLNNILAAFLFVFTPMFLFLSNYFKYDIALVFWVLLSFVYFVKYSRNPNVRNFLLACFFSGVSFAVKVSALPLVPIIILAYFLFTVQPLKNLKRIILGILVFLFMGIMLGIPDLIFGGRNMNIYLYENIIGSSQLIKWFNLHDSLFNVTFLHKLPAMFGHPLYYLSVLAIIHLIYLTIKDFKNKKNKEFKFELFILLSFFIFCLSFISLGVAISANRIIILLPFVILIDCLALNRLLQSLKDKLFIKNFVYAFLLLAAITQIFESVLWLQLKVLPSPQEVSSVWIQKNIPKGSVIGLENIPIYQFEPDFVLKDFYNKQYHPTANSFYKYVIVDSKTRALPQYLVISNIEYEKKYYKTSAKNILVNRLSREEYKKIAYFPLNLNYYKYFDSQFYYPFLGLFNHPDGITVFNKNK
jgi:glycosyltransferase involved in cell wall biosynthesis